MKTLLILLFAVLAVARSMPTELQCDIDEAHTNFGVPREVDDDSNSLMISNFELSLNEVEDGFLPEIEYAVSLKSNSNLFEEFLVTANNLDPHCDHGTMIDKYDIGTPDEDCPHVIRQAIVTDMRKVSFSWKAPQCGCVSFRATVKNAEHVYSESSSEKGALFKEVCLIGMNKSDEEEEMEAIEKKEVLEEEPFYDEELYENIERLCEEGNFRGPILPAIIKECCLLPVQQRRMCLVRVIPGEEVDIHRLDTFCSKIAGNFFNGHPVLANSDGVRRCCELTSDSDRMVCLSEEKRMHYDEICSLSGASVNNTMEDRLPGRNCCSLHGDLRYNCMETKALRENQKRRLEERRNMRRKVEKVKRLCNAVDQTPEGDRDSEDYQTCCMVEDVDDALACFREVERNNFDGLCKKQALRYRNGKKERVHPCCRLESEARYECFLVKRSNNQQSRINSTRTPAPNTLGSGRPTWIQRTCAKLRKEDADETLSACCQQSTFLKKRRCMDKIQNYALAKICNATNEGVSYAIVEGESLKAAKRNLHPEHECCILDGEERMSCIKAMRMSMSKLRRQDSSEKPVRVEAPREQKEQRWVKEERRQNEAIRAAVREDVDMIDEQVIRCCEKDGESQRECLAVLRRNHFTAVCNTEDLFQIDIFNTILLTEDPINDEHRCCLRPNADIRAACFSRIDRQVAMLSYSPPVIEQVQDIRTELLAVAEFNRIDNVCQELESATSLELKGRWPVKKCCRYQNNRRYTCLMDTAKRLADQSCDGPPPRVYFPMGFYGEYIPSDYTGPFLDPSHPCCSLTSDMRRECIQDASMAVLALRLPIIEVKPMVEFFKEMPSDTRFDANHQEDICQAAEDFQILYADLENGLDVELNQPSGIQAELQELQDLLAEELTEDEEEQMEQLAEQNEERSELLAEQEEERLEMLEEQAQQLAEQNQQNEEEEDEEDDRRRKRRQANRFRRPTAKKVRASAGRSIYEVDSLVLCCQENSVAEANSCMTNLWVQLLDEACAALPYLPDSSSAMSTGLESASELAQDSNNVLAPAPLKFGGRGDIKTSKAVSMSSSESTVDSDEDNFRLCCALFGEAQLKCFQRHYSPNAPSSQMESGGSANPSTGGSVSEGYVYESQGQASERSESEGQESERSESEGSEGEEPEESEGAEEPQEQMESEIQEPESEEEGDSGEVTDELDMEMPGPGSPGGSGGVPLGITEVDGQTADGEGPEVQGESQDPQEHTESEGQGSESEGEEPEESEGEQGPQEQMESEGEENESEGEEAEESEGAHEPHGVMESEGQQSESEDPEFDGEEPEESEGEQGPQEQMESEGEENESEEEEAEESEGAHEPHGVMESEGQQFESEDPEFDGEEPEESEGEQGPQEQMESEGEENESEEEEAEESEGAHEPHGVMESEGQQFEPEDPEFDGEEPEESEGEQGPQEQMESEGEENESEGEEAEESEGAHEPHGVMESEGQQFESEDPEFEGEEPEESEGEQGPQEQMESEGEENESEEEEAEESEGAHEPHGVMESEGQQFESEDQEFDGEEPEESEGEQEPLEQMESGGEEIESEGEEAEESEGAHEPHGVMESEGQQFESEDPEFDGEEPEESEGEQGPQEQMESEGEENESEGEEAEESEGAHGPHGVMESEGQQSESEDPEFEGEEPEESEGEQELLEQMESGGEEIESEGEEVEESEGAQEPQGQSESEGQESESEGEEPETEELEESEGVQEPQEQQEDIVQETEQEEEETGGWFTWWSGGKKPLQQEQLDAEEEEEEDRRRRRDVGSWMLPDEEESEGSEGTQGAQEQMEGDGQESETGQNGGWWNWWTNGNEPQTQEQHGGEEEEEEEEEEEDEGSRRKRDIWSAMELLNDIEDEQNYKQKHAKPGNNHQGPSMHNHQDGPKKHRPGRIFGKMSLLKLLFKNEMMESLCPAVEAADNIQSVIRSLSDLAELEQAPKRRDHSRGNDVMLLQLKECCARNITDEKIECIANMTQNIVNGICDIQDAGFRPRPSYLTKWDGWGKKRFLSGCCNETGVERYSCVREYLVPAIDIEDMVESGQTETNPVDLFHAVGKAVVKLLTLTDQDAEDHAEDVDQETTTTTTTTPDEIFPWNSMRVGIITKMCCKVGSLTGALLGENGGVTCDGGAKVYSKFVEESMRSECFAAYTKCCSRPAE